MSDVLQTVKRAAEAKAEAEAHYVTAIVGAHAAGVSYADLARELGLSRQAVRQLVERHKPAAAEPSEAEMEARLSDLNARWDMFIDNLTSRFMPDEETRRREQAYRNVQNGRAKRQAAGRTRNGNLSGASSWKSTIRPTVTEEARRLAETFALRYLEENASHPVCVKVIGELDEAAALSDRLTALRDSRVPFLHD